jgi:hypothetical protein
MKVIIDALFFCDGRDNLLPKQVETTRTIKRGKYARPDR